MNSVLLIHPNAERYGADRALLVLAGVLLDRRLRVAVVLGQDGPLRSDLEQMGVTVALREVGALRRVEGMAGVARLLRRLPRVVRELSPLAGDYDLVHVNSSVVVGGVLAGAAARKPVVVHVRESYAGRRWMWWAWCLVLSVVARRVVAVSEAIRAEAPPWLRRRTVVVADCPSLPAEQAEGGEGIVCIGRINDWKGQDVLVRALADSSLRALRPAVTFVGDVYPGGEGYRRQLQELVAQLGLEDRVTFAGYTDAPATIARRAGIAVFPSRRPEPFGFALVECMAMGHACIATGAGGPADIVDHGVTGLLVPPDDAAALARSIACLIRDPALRARIGAAARTHVRERYRPDRHGDAIADVYRQALRAGRKGAA
ncbi:MAG TPA: glycosyltransferase family 4 protein [Acidimicrobiales bacterium]|nr:glycosyltransferase family 4 protein [Acidimicrobiales bacterium]